MPDPPEDAATVGVDQEWVEQVVADLQWWASASTGLTPTSQITGGGAIGALEEAMRERHGGRPALMVSSATAGMRVLLQVHGVTKGDEVLVPAVDWPATSAAVTSLGAHPVVVDVDPATLTLDPQAVRGALTARTTAVVVCHVLGIAADVPAVVAAAGAIPVLEDCAQSFGAVHGHHPVGTMGAGAVHSLGPGKRIDAGEGGVIVLGDDERFERAVRLACHPIRQLLTGITDPTTTNLACRPHPVAAVQALAALHRGDTDLGTRDAQHLRRTLTTVPGVTVLGPPGTHHHGAVPFMVGSATPADLPAGVTASPAHCPVLPGAAEVSRRVAERVWLARWVLRPRAAPRPRPGPPGP